MASSIEDAVLSSMTARATSNGTSNGGALRRIACLVLPRLPFVTERTDVLACQSKTDIREYQPHRDLAFAPSDACPLEAPGRPLWRTSRSYSI